MSETEPHYQLKIERHGTLDVLQLLVEVQEQFFSDEIRELEAIRKKIKHNIQSTLGISAAPVA